MFDFGLIRNRVNWNPESTLIWKRGSIRVWNPQSNWTLMWKPLIAKLTAGSVVHWHRKNDERGWCRLGRTLFGHAIQGVLYCVKFPPGNWKQHYDSCRKSRPYNAVLFKTSMTSARSSIYNSFWNYCRHLVWWWKRTSYRRESIKKKHPKS